MKLALIGKNISHSRSPEIYKTLLKENLSSYDLLDFESAAQIPSAINLLTKFDGINITSPYKTHFMNEVMLVDTPHNIPGINCLRRNENKCEGTNTDFLAIKDILISMKNDLADKEVQILGDGVMSKITELVLSDLKISYKILSRKKTKNFSQLTFADSIIINTCSRDYVFSGNLGKNIIFWDYNYNFLPHQNTLPLKCEKYIDGNFLLELQASFAVKFFKNVTL